MGRIFYDVMQYAAALDVAVDNAMQTYVADKAKEIIQESIENNVYSAHKSEWTGPPPARRMKDGGIQDEANLDHAYSNLTLTITETATWQHRFDKNTAPPATDLGEVIEKNGMYGAGARPFMRTAEIMAQDRMDKILQTALLFEGF